MNIKDLLKAKYIDIVCKTVFDDSMRKYFSSEIYSVLKLADDKLLAVEKPRIQTSFCYGFDEISDAYGNTHTCDEAATHALYGPNKKEFFYENLKDLDRKIESIKNKEMILSKKYDGRADNVVSLSTKELLQMTNNPDYSDISEEDFTVILNEYNELRKYFVKRLETYWKRFGNTKLRCWSYSVND